MSQPIERESMEVDVLFIGAGPATLASAIHLMREVEQFNQTAEARGKPPIEPPTVLVLEKSASVGDPSQRPSLPAPLPSSRALRSSSLPSCPRSLRSWAPLPFWLQRASRVLRSPRRIHRPDSPTRPW